MTTFASAAGLWLAIYLYGPLLDPRQVTWLIQGTGDSLQHYMGWEFFRDDEWRWPLGAMGNLASEIGTSIVYTDSVPLVAFLLKPIQAWLPEPFQYLGLVVAGNLVLNAGVSCWVLMRCGVRPLTALLGALLVLLQPSATMRGIGAHGHEALSAHWLLWLGIYLLLLHPRLSVGSALRWLGLLAAAILMHFYLFFMVGVLWTGWWLRAGWLDRKWQTPGLRWRWLMTGALTPALILLVMWAAGYFHYGADGGSGSGYYGVFSAEVLTYLNPLSRAWFMEGGLTSLSYFFPGWLTPVGGQYEGQAYAGLGGLLLLAMGTAVLGNRGWREACRNWPSGMTWLLLLGIAMFIFALSDRVVLGYRVFDLGYRSWLGPLADVLRSSGRLVWPLLYILLLSTLVLLARQWSHRRLAWVLAGLVILQWTDLLEWHRWMQHRTAQLQQASSASLPHAVLHADELEPVWQSHQRIVALPADDIAALQPYTWLAATYDMSINVAHLARITADTVAQATSAERQRIQDGELSADAVYVLTSPEWAQRACAITTVQCREFESVTVAWRARNQPLERE